MRRCLVGSEGRGGRLYRARYGEDELEDLAYAVKVMAAEMIDNRQITAQYTGKNPMVMQILDLHSTNLLPSEG